MSRSGTPADRGNTAALPLDGADAVLPFVFEHEPVRGALVSLDVTWREVLARRSYPAPLLPVMGEAMAAAALLAGSMKLTGPLVLQLRGHGPLSLLVVECGAELGMRATAKWRANLQAPLLDMIGDGRFVITLNSGQGQQAYQGVVAGEGETLADMLEHYMGTSEQVATRLWLAADETRCSGLFLQRLPRAADDDETWRRATILAGSLRAGELLRESSSALLRKLFHEETLRVFSSRPTQFRCNCGRPRVGDMLRALGRDEVEDIVREQGQVEVACDFCNQAYRFDPVDVAQLFATESTAAPSATKH